MKVFKYKNAYRLTLAIIKELKSGNFPNNSIRFFERFRGLKKGEILFSLLITKSHGGSSYEDIRIKVFESNIHYYRHYNSYEYYFIYDIPKEGIDVSCFVRKMLKDLKRKFPNFPPEIENDD